MQVRRKLGRARRQVKARVEQELWNRLVARHQRRFAAAAVSVIIPVYNAMPYLAELLDSLQAQDIDPTAFEVIAIDDGSTDGSGECLDDYARRFRQLLVVHQANSGWPGIPRNRGIDLASGRYVFFADADDALGPSALRLMTEYADAHGTDVLLPRMAGLNGRWVRASMYRHTVADADLFTVFRTLSPQKMFRLSMLREHHIRFPEEKVRLEDGMVMAKAYLTARRVSILGETDHYLIRERDDGQNISATKLIPEGYSWSVGEVARIIRENTTAEIADPLVLDLYRRKCLKFYSPGRWERTTVKNRTRWLDAHNLVIDAHIPPDLEARLEVPFRQRSELVRAKDIPGLDRWMNIERALQVSGDLTASRLAGDHVELDLTVVGPVDEAVDIVAVLTTRDQSHLFEVELEHLGRGALDPGPRLAQPATADDEDTPDADEFTAEEVGGEDVGAGKSGGEEVQTMRAHVPVTALDRAYGRLWDLWLQPRAGAVEPALIRVGVAASSPALQGLSADLDLYATKHGNATLRLAPPS